MYSSCDQINCNLVIDYGCGLPQIDPAFGWKRKAAAAEKHLIGSPTYPK